MNEPTQFLGTRLDLVVTVGYFLFIVAFGLVFGRYTKTTKDYFFGGQRFAWWLIAFSCVATTVGSYSFQKYSKVGFDFGISSTQSYLNDWFWMAILLLIWLPIIYYQRIGSIPEYFERRFGPSARVGATLLILLYIVAYIGINVFTVGKVLNALLGWDVVLGAIATTALVALYVIFGGQTSVIMTDLAQGIILLVAGLGVVAVGIWHFGGFGDFWALLPQSHKFAFSEFAAPDKFSFIGIWGQDGLCNTGAFMLMNQGIVMRFLSLKSVKDARKMAVCWILVLAPLAAIATSGPGWIGRALVENGDLEMTASDAFVRTAHFLCAPGIFGFVLAALTAALMSTADTLINAASAIFVNDVWRQYIRPKADDKSCLLVARISSIVVAALGMALVPLYMEGKDSSVYQAHALVTGSIPAPVVVAILLGILWKRYSPKAATATLFGGIALIAVTFFSPFDEFLLKPFSFGMGDGSYKFTRALYGLTVCGVLGIVVSLFTKPKPTAQMAGLITGTQVQGMELFKGAKPNLRPGRKARVRVEVDPALTGDEAIVPASAMTSMDADPGDMVYVCDTRWWFGGLRSVHVRAHTSCEGDAVRVSAEALESAHLRDGQNATVEKII
ncbi:MAG: sodium/solute symporter [bacterium]|nr:sodium/solute symporter [bacterium]